MPDDLRHRELYAILAECWDLLERSARHPESRLHAPVLASAGPDGLPDARTVVIEATDAATRRLFVNTDRRSPKFRELKANPQVMFVFYEGPTQVRARAEVTLHEGDRAARRSWEALPERYRAHYRRTHPPGTPIPREQALAPAAPAGDGWDNYGVIEARVTAMDWLRVEGETERRAAFAWNDEGYIAAHWLSP